jgi:site-specific DNA-methyltransferase (adenine-specific)
MITPYYDHGNIQIYHGDCLEVLPELPQVDLVLTDPPYPDYHKELYRFNDGLLWPLKEINKRQFIFWSAKAKFPLDYTAIHIWDKKTGCGSVYERIFERNGQKNFKVFRHYLINSSVAENYTGDINLPHPSQKPIRLLRELINKNSKPNNLILDPFMGSGTTLVAAKELGRKAIGIEIEEKYIKIAIKRLSQEVLPLRNK